MVVTVVTAVMAVTMVMAAIITELPLLPLSSPEFTVTGQMRSPLGLSIYFLARTRERCSGVDKNVRYSATGKSSHG